VEVGIAARRIDRLQSLADEIRASGRSKSCSPTQA
jgi:NADP-dependent 3-hydroxy acid dehydrogenase YdfG